MSLRASEEDESISIRHRHCTAHLVAHAIETKKRSNRWKTLPNKKYFRSSTHGRASTPPSKPNQYTHRRKSLGPKEKSAELSLSRPLLTKAECVGSLRNGRSVFAPNLKEKQLFHSLFLKLSWLSRCPAHVSKHIEGFLPLLGTYMWSF